MGLPEVVQEVRNGAEQQAKAILADAQAQADKLMQDAQAQASAYEAERLAQAERDVEQIKKQALSNAQFEARKTVLATENELRAELRQHIVDGLRELDGKTREGHIVSLLKQAAGIIPAGKVWGAAADEKALKASSYEFAGATDIAGGIVVESIDGKERLDLSYETLLGDVWREVLTAEAGLFN